MTEQEFLNALISLAKARLHQLDEERRVPSPQPAPAPTPPITPPPVKPQQSITPPSAPLVYTIVEAAKELKIHPNSVRSLIDRRLIKVSRGLRHIRIARSEIERYIKETTL